MIANHDWIEGCRRYIPLQKFDASLYTAYDGCLTTLRRLASCKSSLKIFLVRVPKCKLDRPCYCVNQANWVDISYTIFNLLAKEEAPFIVIGNLGFRLASCLKLITQFEEDYHTKLKYQVQITFSKDQQLLCMFKKEKD